ncbi:YkgJ family cysteine cluster protein [Helicobacter brantae]|uniref:YkgJ family cysteine cluster protein n=2 Tax=Helicobacter brantae TaxID=375927 RepID=A0A3D8J2R1_9HELI|nr:YkgJ family cysteine cluster protein [Helicobacter brantae]RDU71807.1 YkgJ family cysteine cluster protein [Helicobacter brantae]
MSLSEENIFSCDKCGACCCHISTILELQEYDLGNGVCKFFDISTKECKIYNTRPLVCRVDEMFEEKYKSLMSKKDFYKKNLEICEMLKKGEI